MPAPAFPLHVQRNGTQDRMRGFPVSGLPARQYSEPVRYPSAQALTYMINMQSAPECHTDGQ